METNTIDFLNCFLLVPLTTCAACYVVRQKRMLKFGRPALKHAPALRTSRWRRRTIWTWRDHSGARPCITKKQMKQEDDLNVTEQTMETCVRVQWWTRWLRRIWSYVEEYLNDQRGTFLIRMGCFEFWYGVFQVSYYVFWISCGLFQISYGVVEDFFAR